ncbi:MAG: PilZ domain-containing protein [Desulfobacterales bacterium]|nr:PilZ domain-containing protein [Desulfobacterales bacterium]
MSKKIPAFERRKEERYMASEGAFAAIEKSSKAGQVINISKGGLCFKYIVDNKENRSLPEEYLSLVSMSSFVGALQYEIVGEYPVLNISPFSSMECRRCHVRFTNLDTRQKSDLAYYIHKNTVQSEDESVLKPRP